MCDFDAVPSPAVYLERKVKAQKDILEFWEKVREAYHRNDTAFGIMFGAKDNPTRFRAAIYISRQRAERDLETVKKMHPNDCIEIENFSFQDLNISDLNRLQENPQTYLI